MSEQNKNPSERMKYALAEADDIQDKFKADNVGVCNALTDGWVGVIINPKCSGRFTVDSSYGVRDAFFADGFFTGDYRWQDCQTGNDEGMKNYDGIEFKVYNWMPLPNPPKAASCGE